MNKVLVATIVLLLVATSGCVDTGGDKKSLEDFFEENKKEVLLTNETVIEGSYFVGRIKSVDEIPLGNGIYHGGQRRYCCYSVVFEDRVTIRTFNMKAFPYKIGGVNGIQFSTEQKTTHYILGRAVVKVVL